MSTPEERIRELGLEIPDVAAPLASYVPAARSGSFVYTAGQLPIVKGELAATGKVGAEIDPERATELARLCGLNAIAAIRAEIGIFPVYGASSRSSASWPARRTSTVSRRWSTG